MTDANGAYIFQALPPGTYTVHTVQPAGYWAEDSDPGSVGGVSVDLNTIGSVVLPGGINGINYNFCELPPGSIAGRVHKDVDGQCETNPNEPGLAGVTVQLLNQPGNVIATAVTDSDGAYDFQALPPGTYSVHVVLPAGYFAEDSDPGSTGGVRVDLNTIGSIALMAGVNSINNNFCELPPGQPFRPRAQRRRWPVRNESQ